MLWSRLGGYETAELGRLLWKERRLFEYNAFIWPVEALPGLRFVMERFAAGDGVGSRRVRDFLAANDAFARLVERRLQVEGPLRSRSFSADAGKLAEWRSGGWNDGLNVTRMLGLMHARGRLMVAGRDGNERLWDLADRVLPADALAGTLSADDFARNRALDAVRRLGVATVSEIRARVPFVGRAAVDLAVGRLRDEGAIVRVQTGDRAPAFVRPIDLAALEDAAWSRTTLLSPFDPLITDRQRTERLFGFSYRLEMYVPKAQRRFGHFVLPILHGDRLIGRVDPLMDRRSGALRIAAVHAEADAPADAGEAIGSAIRDLGSWLGAREVAYADVPAVWRARLPC